MSAQALLDLTARRQYDLVILGDFPKQSELIVAIRGMRLVAPKVRVLVFTEVPERLYGPHCLQSGAVGFISKRCSVKQVAEAIRVVISGNKYIGDILKGRLLEYTLLQNLPSGNPLLALSIRELLVTDMLCEGMWIKEIAGSLGLKTSSVSTYKQRIFEKLNVQTLLEMYCKVQDLKRSEL